MRPKWVPATEKMQRMFALHDVPKGSPVVHDTGWRLHELDWGHWLLTHRRHAPLTHSNEDEAKWFAESTYILEDSDDDQWESNYDP